MDEVFEAFIVGGVPLWEQENLNENQQFSGLQNPYDTRTTS